MDLFTLVGKIAIDSTEAETKIDSLLTKAGQLNAALDGTGGTGGTGTTGATSTGTTSASGTTTAQAVATGNLLSRFIEKAINVAGGWVVDWGKEGYAYEVDKEKYIAELKTMMDSTWEEAESFFNDLNTLSITTPLNMSSIGTGAARFLSLGFEPDRILEMMQVLGDLAKGDNFTFERIVKAVSDVYGKAGLKAQEKNQFAEAGVPILALLADYYGDPYETQKEKDSFNSWIMGYMETGGMISPDDVWGAIVQSTQEGGRFYNAMGIAMETISGQTEKAEELSQQVGGKILDKYGFMNLSKWWLETKNSFLEGTNQWLDGESDKPLMLDFLTHIPFQEQFSEWFINHLPQFDSFTDEEWEEELRQRREDAGRLDPESAGDLSSFQTTIDNWTSAFDMDGLKTAIAAAAKEGVTEGLSGVTITTGSVTLNDGVLVGRIAPRINLALGQMAARDLRG